MVQKGRGPIHKAFVTDGCFSTTGLSSQLSFFGPELCNTLYNDAYSQSCEMKVLLGSCKAKITFFDIVTHIRVREWRCVAFFLAERTVVLSLFPRTRHVPTHSPEYWSTTSALYEWFFSGRSLSKYEYQIITVKIKAQVDIAIYALGLPVFIASWGCFLLPRDILLPFYTADSKMSPSLNA